MASAHRSLAALLLSVMCITPAGAFAAPKPQEADASPLAWWLMVEDLGCPSCRGEVYLNGELLVLQSGGQPNTLVEVTSLLRAGSNEVKVFVRGPRGAGRMAVTVAKGSIRNEVVVFRGTPTRYALQPEPSPLPLTFEVSVDPSSDLPPGTPTPSR